MREDVLEMARRRIRWLFREFDGNVMVSTSGGKDSTIVYHLALEAARELEMLPLKVCWIDQEAEWRATVEISEEWMSHPDVEPVWLQVPFHIKNATSRVDAYLHCWDPERPEAWVHPKHPTLSIHENVFGADQLYKLFAAVMRFYYGTTPACSLSGMRAEEAPTRRLGITTNACYKWVTWGGWQDPSGRFPHFLFHPIYDWSWTDVWKAIHDGGWRYNTVYDRFYQYGMAVRNMRVSHLHHEQAVKSLFYLQEIEPETYARLVARIEGIDMAGKFGTDYFIRELPFMFDTWVEYRDYLLERLVGDGEHRRRLASRFESIDSRTPPDLREYAAEREINSILCNDWDGDRLNHFLADPAFRAAQRRWLEQLQAEQVGA
jgi:predicted phosphoadenosine phosphosulfate sulfurtransferase